MKPSPSPGWEISLSWTQQIAAFWSISWPAWIISLLLVAVFASGSPASDPVRHANWLSLGANSAFFVIQSILSRRLVRKNYRTFRIEVLRHDGMRNRTLSLREAGLVWLWILGPQVALFLGASLFALYFGAKMPPETMRSVSSLVLWLRILLAGPYGIRLAMDASYPGFRLQAYGKKY